MSFTRYHPYHFIICAELPTNLLNIQKIIMTWMNWSVEKHFIIIKLFEYMSILFENKKLVRVLFFYIRILHCAFRFDLTWYMCLYLQLLYISFALYFITYFHLYLHHILVFFLWGKSSWTSQSFGKKIEVVLDFYRLKPPR